MTTILYGAAHGRYPATELDWANCGTAANYRAHLRRGEKPCLACRTSYAEYRRAQRAKQRET